MDTLTASRITGGNSAYGRAKSDFYPTPPDATIALLNYLNLPKDLIVWEPACGEGHMVEAIESQGYKVIGTDIQTGDDFLAPELKQINFNCIITNPPFSKSEEFIRRCAEYNKPFALLLKSQYWHAKKRKALFEEITPTDILPLTWRPDFLFKTRGNGSPLMDVMWVVWGFKNISGIAKYKPLDRPKMEDQQ